MRNARLWLLGCLIAIAGTPALSAQYLPQPRDYVEDHAGVIDASTKRRLNNLLAELERKTGAQLIVLTLDTTQGIPINEFAIEQAMRWKLGRKGHDDGVIAVIAVRDRDYSIQVGYGLEPSLPDGFVGGIGRQYFQPAIKNGDYSTGIYQGVAALAQQIAHIQNVTLDGSASSGGVGNRGIANLFGTCAFPVLIIILMLISARGRSRAYGRWGGGSSNLLLWMMIGNVLGGGGRHRGGWGGGGFGGGGFGGGGFGGGSFGGGGGGSFGGGGASGSW